MFDRCGINEINTGYAIAERFYSAAYTGAWDNIDDLFTDDFVISEAEGLPFHTVLRGKSALRDLYAFMTGFWSDFRAELKAVTVGQDHIIGLLQASGRARGTDKSFSMPVVEVIRLDGAKIAEVLPVWWDTKLISHMFDGTPGHPHSRS